MLLQAHHCRFASRSEVRRGQGLVEAAEKSRFRTGFKISTRAQLYGQYVSTVSLVLLLF